MNSEPAKKRDDHRSTEQPSVSVVINNYNYAAYLSDTIESALAQGYPYREILVVDDGSTDCSCEVIAEYGSQITPIFKANGGQASALNAGYDACHGEIILFLDADDILLPNALANIVAMFGDPSISNVHWAMWVIDAQGKRIGSKKPAQPPGDGDFREQLLQTGPSNLPSSPTSGNAWSNAFLERVMPIPEHVEYYRTCADEYLYTLAPAFGRLRTIADPQSCYRIHGRNIYSGRSFREKLHLELSGYDQQCAALRAALERNGMSVDLKQWKQHSWFHRLDRAISNVLSAVPDESEFVLVDGGTWDADEAFGQRSARPFFERDGNDWGPPPNGGAAITQLDSIRRNGIEYLVIAWPSFWWFDEYREFFDHLNGVVSYVLKNDVVAIYKLPQLQASNRGRPVSAHISDSVMS
jgi:glycosyltransferase involved in cell wall biosynthesis